jgi:hypothetical protein
LRRPLGFGKRALKYPPDLVVGVDDRSDIAANTAVVDDASLRRQSRSRTSGSASAP